MKRSTHIAIAEPSDILYEGLSSLLYHSNNEYIISRLFSIDDIDSVLTNKRTELLLVNPIFIFNNEKELKKLRKNFQHLLIGCVNMSIVNNYTLSLYDFTLNIYDSSDHILSMVKRQLTQKQATDDSTNDDETLSDRETEVLLQIIKGFTNKEIAEILYISVHTVISHRKNIMLKTGIRSQAGLALYAVSKSLISLDDFDL